jgi:hypothetical protein
MDVQAQASSLGARSRFFGGGWSVVGATGGVLLGSAVGAGVTTMRKPKGGVVVGYFECGG